MRKIFFVHAISLSFVLTSCGGGGGNSSNSPDSSGENDCTAYNDSGYSNGNQLQLGQMPSDISLSPIPACSKGQFIFNGTCWNSIQFNDSTGEVDFINSTQSESILKPFQIFSNSVQNVMSSIQNLTNSVDCVLNPQSNIQTKSCTVDYQMYYDLLNYTAYSVWALHQWGWDHSQLSGGSYGPQYAFGEAILSLKTTFGKCSNSNKYDWYNNGNIVLNSHSFQLPLSAQNFISVYPNATNISCPFNLSGWSCYSVKTSWGTQSFNFDTNGNLNSMQLNYLNSL